MGIGDFGIWDCDWGFGLEIGDSDWGSELRIGIAQWDYRWGLGIKMTIDIEYWIDVVTVDGCGVAGFMKN